MHRLYESFLAKDAPEPCDPSEILELAFGRLQFKATTMDIQLAATKESSFEKCDTPWLTINHMHTHQILFILTRNAFDAVRSVASPAITISMSASLEVPAQLETQPQDVNMPDHLQFNAKAWHACSKAQASDSVNPVYLRFAVQDNGPGISQEVQRNIFKKFTPANGNCYRPDGRLGLSGVRQLVELQGGKVSLTSRRGAGTTVAFYIKTYTTQALDESTRVSMARTVELAVREFCSRDGTVIEFRSPQMISPLESILIVEDNLMNQRVITKQLQKHRHAVHVANNGQEALHILAVYNTKKGKAREGTQIALALVDDYMPVMDGSTFCHKVRELERSGDLPGHLPLVGMVANFMPDHVAELREAGMDDVLAKPFRIQQVLNAIKSLARPHEATRAIERCSLCEVASRGPPRQLHNVDS